MIHQQNNLEDIYDVERAEKDFEKIKKEKLKYEKKYNFSKNSE